MRRILSAVAALSITSCAGYRALDRAEWVLVWSDESVHTETVNGTKLEVLKPAPGARQEVINIDRYESEVAEGKRRKASAALGQAPKLITELKGPLQLKVGEVREVRIDEPQEAAVYLMGSVVRPYWTKRKDVAEWKDGQPADRKESSLFLLAEEVGKAQVKVQYPSGRPVLLDVNVLEK